MSINDQSGNGVGRATYSGQAVFGLSTMSSGHYFDSIEGAYLTYLDHRRRSNSDFSHAQKCYIDMRMKQDRTFGDGKGYAIGAGLKSGANYIEARRHSPNYGILHFEEELDGGVLRHDE